MQPSKRHIIGWGGLIVIFCFVAGFMSLFFNLSGYDINIRWIVIPCIALTLFLFPKVKEWIKRGRKVVLLEVLNNGQNDYCFNNSWVFCGLGY